MKPKIYKVVAPVAFALLLNGGIAIGSGIAGDANSSQIVAHATAAKMSDPAQIARGAKAWAETCNRCHNLRDPKEFSDRAWSLIVDHMRVIGPLPGNVANDIKAFLQASN